MVVSTLIFDCFNTQPPEGGWGVKGLPSIAAIGFNTQPPEGGWDGGTNQTKIGTKVSTHSRLKAAGRQAIYQDMPR